MLPMIRSVRNYPRKSALKKWLAFALLFFLQGTYSVSWAQIAINPVTNKIYVGYLAAIRASSTVVVIDGATNQVTKVPVPASPYDLAANTVTNKVYVADYYGGKLTIIDGATNQTTSVQVGLQPVSVAVNEKTNKIYLGNSYSEEATILDGATNAATRVQIAGRSEGQSIAVDALANKTYIGSIGQSKRITVIDGSTNQTKTIQTAGYVFDLNVDPSTNKIYVLNGYIGKVTVIDGATSSVTAISVGHFPTSLAVNPVTHKIYVASGEVCGGIAVIDGKSGEVTRIKAGINLLKVVVNTATNQAYAYDPGILTFIDGNTNKTTGLLLPMPSELQRYKSSATCR
jgi:YVTN family beta-propeller protein